MAEFSKELPLCSSNNSIMSFFETLFEDVIQELKSAVKYVLSPSPESIMYTGGIIRPLAKGVVEEVVEAIGFHGGKVVAAGSKAEVVSMMQSVAGNYTTRELSRGQTLLPGLIEPHVHIISSAIFTAGWNDFGPFKDQKLIGSYNRQYLQEQIDGAKSSLQDGFWILSYGVDPSLMPFEVRKGSLNMLQKFDCDTMDDMESTIPVFMMSASGHTAYVNTKALHAVFEAGGTGYDSFAKYKEAVNKAGGLQEINEIVPAFNAIPKAQHLCSLANMGESLDSLFELATKRGVTMVYDAAMTSQQLQILDRYLAGNPLRVRVGYAHLCNSRQDAESMENQKPITPPLTLFQGSAKIVADGSNQGLTGYQFETYRCEPAGNCGIFNFNDDDFMEMVKNLVDKDWPLMIHGNGDKAICKILNAYEAALKGTSGLIKRHRIEHCSLLDETKLKKMAKLGISPSFLIGHVGYWGYVFRNAIFEEKALTLDTCQSALRHKMRITLHSDYFVTPLGPLRAMEQAITRIMEQDPNCGVLNAAEKLTPSQAIRAVTYDAAWQCHVDQWLGSLEEGKMADYVILAEDPITMCNPKGMRDIPVLETWVGGVKFTASD